MTVDIWFGQFNTVGGVVEEQGPYVGVFDGGDAEADVVAVYVVVEPCDGAPAELCATTVDVIARGFGDPAQALTANLLRALNAANTHVRQYHPGATAPDFGVGVSVLAVRRSDAYLAQAGPSLACVRTNGVARLYEPLGEEAVKPVGSDARVMPTFARFQLAVRDTAILLFSEGARLIDRRRLPSLAAESPEHTLPDLYLRSRAAPEFAALYLAVVAQQRTPREPPAGSDPPNERHAAIRPPARVRRVRPATSATTATGEVSESSESAAPANGGLRTVRPRSAPLGRIGPTQSPVTRSRLALAGGVLGLALLALALWPGLARQGKSEKFASLLKSADQSISAAEHEPDPAKQRALLASVQATVDEARSLNSGSGDLSGLEGRLREDLAQLDDVHELADLTQVADLSAPGLAAPAASEIALGAAVYLLDASAGKVVALPREGEPKPATVFEEGRVAGPQRTGRPRHMVWWPPEGGVGGALLVLDDQRRLFTVDAGGDIRPIALGSTADWKSDTALAIGASNLYVLDANANQVWRYSLNNGGFSGAPEALLGNRAVLREASGLTVASAPTVSTSDGRLLRLIDGREAPFTPVAIDRPLLAPAPPLLSLADGLLYVADRGNQRIVRLTADGTFHGQLVHHRLAGLQAITLDEEQGALYAIAGQTLVRASIPR